MFDRSRELDSRLANARPVVVMGRGHSGTRVLAWALEALGIRMGTLPEKSTGDVQDRRFTGCIKRIARHNVRMPALAEPRAIDLRRFRSAAARYLEWLGPAAGGFGWKFPETYLIARVVDRVFPRALYVHMVRDGRDLAFKEHLTDDSGRALGHAILEHLGLLDRPRFIQAAVSWDWQVRRFEEVAGQMPRRVHLMTFEGLCLDPEATMQELCAFLGVPMNAACSEYLAKSIRRAKVAQFREEDAQKVREIEAAIGPTLERFGYALAFPGHGANR